MGWVGYKLKRERERGRHREARESSYSAGNRLDAAVQPKYEAKAQHQKDIARLMVFARDRMGVGMGMEMRMGAVCHLLDSLPFEIFNRSPFKSVSRSLSLSFSLSLPASLLVRN